jgi:hypothetical protein
MNCKLTELIKIFIDNYINISKKLVRVCVSLIFVELYFNILLPINEISSNTIGYIQSNFLNKLTSHSKLKRWSFYSYVQIFGVCIIEYV